MARKRRLPSTASKLARLHSPPRCASTTLALSRNTNGGSTSAASTTIRTAASSDVWYAARRDQSVATTGSRGDAAGTLSADRTSRATSTDVVTHHSPLL